MNNNTIDNDNDNDNKNDNDNDNEIYNDNDNKKDKHDNNRQYSQFSETLQFICMITIAYLYILYDDVIPYMDEIFHIPQAKEYCNGNFSYWNDKITTFPGLYYISVIIVKICNALNYWFVFYDDDQIFCSHQYLRLHNVSFSIIGIFIYNQCYYQLYKYEYTKKKKNDDDIINDNDNDDIEYIKHPKHIRRLIAITLALYPLNFFYYFMYYTDTMSNIILIMTYGYALQWKLLTSFPQKLIVLLLASLSILLRQTNSIWILFIAGTNMVEYLESERYFNDNQFSMSNIFKFIKLLILKLFPLLSLSWPLLLPVCAFIYFIYVNNGSVVVGDKENHQFSLHPVMPLHMLATCSVFIAPVLISDLLNLFKIFKEKKVKEYLNVSSMLAHILGLVVIGLILAYGSKDHPFLLADNRHYTFYIWRWFLKKRYIRILLSPLYYYLILRVISRVRQYRGPIWISIYLLAAFLTLIPASLLEIRYFTPGVLIFVLNGSLRKSSSLYMIIGIFSIVNYIFISNYLERTFTWPDGSIARFMP